MKLDKAEHGKKKRKSCCGVEELIFRSSRSIEEIEKDFEGLDLFSGLMEGLREALVYEQGAPSKNTIATERTTPAWVVRDVRAFENYTLLITFASGEVKLYDARPLLEHPLYAPLKDRNFFLKAHVECGTVVWSDEVDIAPEHLYEQSLPMRQDNPAIGRDALEYMETLLATEEIDASNRSAAVLGRLIKARQDTVAALCDYIAAIEADEQVRLAVEAKISDMAAMQDCFDVEAVESLLRITRQKLGKS